MRSKLSQTTITCLHALNASSVLGESKPGASRFRPTGRRYFWNRQAGHLGTAREDGTSLTSSQLNALSAPRDKIQLSGFTETTIPAQYTTQIPTYNYKSPINEQCQPRHIPNLNTLPNKTHHGRGTTTAPASTASTTSNAGATVYRPMPSSLGNASQNNPLQRLPLPPRLLHRQAAPATLHCPVGPTVKSGRPWLCLSGCAKGESEGGWPAVMRGRQGQGCIRTRKGSRSVNAVWQRKRLGAS